MTRVRAACVVFLLLAALPMGARGQPVSLDAVVHALGAGDAIRLDVSRSGRVEGRFIVATATTLTLTSHDSRVLVPLPDIERLWVQARATRKGAVIGAGVGALIGIVGGLLIGGVACEPVDGGDCTPAQVAATVGILGGGGGAALGAGVGFAFLRWRPRFP